MSQSMDVSRDAIKEYYGKVLETSESLKTNACCTGESVPTYLRDIIGAVHEEVRAKYYGCGLVIPNLLQGMKVLDLGSGSGRDAFIVSRLVGESGEVVGVDMTDEQLDVARRHIGYHTETYGYEKPNIRFEKGYIERLDELDLPDNHFDVIISNCVINLSPDKEAVLKEAYRVLRKGGELYFADVYADRRISEELTQDPILYGECLSGALYTRDFFTLARNAGFVEEPRTVKRSPITVENPYLQEKLGGITFQSLTHRLFKADQLDMMPEDYGQSVTYHGTIPHTPGCFELDINTTFATGEKTPVSGNTYHILKQSRFAPHFDYHGCCPIHQGPFDVIPQEIPMTDTSMGSCCG